jgi:hypothetical protein
LELRQTVSVLHNPRYAGAYAFGRYRSKKLPDGRTKRELVPREHWHSLLPDAHPGYITWEEFERIEQLLRESARAYGALRRHGPPREGPALLQGKVICGLCGCRMAVRYHRRGQQLVPDYQCIIRTAPKAQNPCQVIPGASIDAATGKLVVEAMTPMAVEVALAVWQEIQQRHEEADRLRRQHVERAQYEVDLARRRYMQVDPSNRLVADSLEAEWNDKLRVLSEAQNRYQQQKALDESRGKQMDQKRVLSLVKDFPAIWNDPNTPQRERKRMIGLLIEDVTLIKKETITTHVRFRGGATTTLTLPLPLNAWQGRMTPATTLHQIDVLLEKHTDSEVARILNQRGLKTGAHARFKAERIRWLRYVKGIKSLKQRLLDKGWLTTEQYADKLGVHYATIKAWRDKGLIHARMCNDRGQWLFDPRANDPPTSRGPRTKLRQQGDNHSNSKPAAGGAV